MKIWSKDEIIARFDPERAVPMIEQGFIAHSRKAAQVPPVQHFRFDAESGDCCVKSAHVHGADTFAVKISTGFYNNPKRGLPSNNGLTLLFSAHTGEPVALLQDEGWLTCVRTAIAGSIAARLLAPRKVQAIGILGTGVQAKLQLEFLKPVTDCRDVYVWGRTQEELDSFSGEMARLGFNIHTTRSPSTVAEHANLIVTATPSCEALLQSSWIRPGTHITAVGADSEGKQELDPAIVARADKIVVDSIDQCGKYGEVSHALLAKWIQPHQLVELGSLLATTAYAREDDDQITIADLTGVAVQDAQVANSLALDPS